MPWRSIGSAWQLWHVQYEDIHSAQGGIESPLLPFGHLASRGRIQSKSCSQSTRRCQVVLYLHRDVTYSFLLFGCVDRSDDLLWELQALQMIVPPNDVDMSTTLDNSQSGGASCIVRSSYFLITKDQEGACAPLIAPQMARSRPPRVCEAKKVRKTR